MESFLFGCLIIIDRVFFSCGLLGVICIVWLRLGIIIKKIVVILVKIKLWINCLILVDKNKNIN